MTTYKPWSCDRCTAGCTFEAMSWCAKRSDSTAECGYDRDQPLARYAESENRPPDRDGHFEFVVEG